MVITYYGASCFKIQSGDIILVFDPPSKKSGFKSPRFQADIVFVSHDHDNHNGYENIPAAHRKTADDQASLDEKDDVPFLINGPGEYEIRGVRIKGIRTFHDNSGGQKEGLNTAYRLNLENINVCHLGDFGEKILRPETQEDLGEVDILFVPINGAIMDIETAASLVNQIEPQIVIPMHYFTKNFQIDKKCLAGFLKEISQEKVSPLEKYTLRKKDIADKEREAIVLIPSIN